MDPQRALVRLALGHAPLDRSPAPPPSAFEIFSDFRHRPMIVLLHPRAVKPKNRRFPLSILSIAAVLEGREHYTIIDGNLDSHPAQTLERLASEHPIELLAVSVMPGPQMVSAIPLCKDFRRNHPGVPIVWGGYFPSLYATSSACPGRIPSSFPFTIPIARSAPPTIFPSCPITASVPSKNICCPPSSAAAPPSITPASDARFAAASAASCPSSTDARKPKLPAAPPASSPACSAATQSTPCSFTTTIFSSAKVTPASSLIACVPSTSNGGPRTHRHFPSLFQLHPPGHPRIRRRHDLLRRRIRIKPGARPNEQAHHRRTDPRTRRAHSRIRHHPRIFLRARQSRK